MGSIVHCIDGPALAILLNRAMGEREADKARLETFSSDLTDASEDIERLTRESGSSFEWLRHLQTALLGERAVLVASGWNRAQNREGVWIWERDPEKRTLLRGLRKAEASDVLTDRIIPIDRSSSLRLAPLRDAASFRVPLLAELVPDGHWSESFNSRRTSDELGTGIPYHEN